jgi:hypothetical protein
LANAKNRSPIDTIINAIEATIKKPVTTDDRKAFYQPYVAGKEALEQGDYRQSIAYLELAKESVNLSSRIGGEIQIWLVTAYQAAGDIQTAISLCKELVVHPNSLVRKQASRVLYIIEAPQLKRPKEWMVEIPDLNNISEEGSSLSIAKKSSSNSTLRKKQEPELEIDPSEINTQDNQFIWVALAVIIVVFAGLFYFSSRF